MSRNFELIQQLGQVSNVAPSRVVTPRVEVEREAPEHGSRLDFDQIAREEALRLVQRVFLLQTQDPPHVVVFAAIDKGSGCSQICASVAETLVNNVRGSICLVEANFRSPALPQMYGTTNHYGLTESLLREGPIRSFAKPLGNENLWLLSCGSLAVDSPNLLNSERIKARFQELRKEFDYILIDAPPMSRYADAMALGKLADGFVLVLEANSTRREAAMRATENLNQAQIRVLGAVLNKRTFPIPESLYRRF
jgi:capsular exopolysaccharide synthesis family protein